MVWLVGWLFGWIIGSLSLDFVRSCSLFTGPIFKYIPPSNTSVVVGVFVALLLPPFTFLQVDFERSITHCPRGFVAVDRRREFPAGSRKFPFDSPTDMPSMNVTVNVLCSNSFGEGDLDVDPSGRLLPGVGVRETRG